VVLHWDARNEEKGKHGKFENLWKGPYRISTFRRKNAFLWDELNGEDYSGGEINGMLLKHYHTLRNFCKFSLPLYIPFYFSRPSVKWLS